MGRLSQAWDTWFPKAAETNKDKELYYWTWLNEACRQFYGGNDNAVFSNATAFSLANCISEIFFPIDAIADRVAGLPFNIVNKNGDIVDAPENIKRLINSPNPFCASFQDMIYNAVFNELSDGNNYIYTNTPRSFKNATPDTISSVWLLTPDQVDIKIKNTRPSFFDITSITDIVEYYGYNSPFDSQKIDPNYVIHERSLSLSSRNVNSTGIKSPSPLKGAEKNINNLIAVYSARYKAYNNNGMGGILSRDNSAHNSEQEAVNPTTRDEILKDILDRHGLTGDKKFWTVSAIPLKFIKTLATISELQPFEETEADALQIAGILGVDKDLIPLKKGTTFTNKEQAEKNLYQNVIFGMAENKAHSFTKAFALDKIGLRFAPGMNNIQVMQPDRETSLKSDGLTLDNISKMQQAGLIDEADAKDIVQKIIDKYKNG
ncbi:MAG: phage portal protein [Prevotella sp.]|nr:phage portal protein [Prevotella sp.]